MNERPLPKSTKETVYRVGRWEGTRSRLIPRPLHVFKVDRVKIGSNYQGEPIFTEYTNHMALCGVYVAEVPTREIVAPEAASCLKCRRLYMQAVASNNPGPRRS